MCVSFTDTFLERKGFLGLDASSDWTVLSILRFEGDDLLAPFVSSGFTFDGGMGTGWALAKISNELGWMAFGTNGEYETVSGGVLEDNQPVVIAAQKQGDAVRLYLNGQIVVHTSIPDFEISFADDAPLSITVGFDSRHRLGSFSGCVAELLVYSRAVDDAELGCLSWQMMQKYQLCEGSQCDEQIEELCTSHIPQSTSQLSSTPQPSTSETLHTSTEASPTTTPITTTTTPMSTPLPVDDGGEIDVGQAGNSTGQPPENRNVSTTVAQTGLEATGVQVVEVHWEWDCLSAGCWVIDIAYFSESNAVNVLYLPRTNGDDQLENGGGYPKEVRQSYGVAAFPCGTDDVNDSEEINVRGTVCCLEAAAARYRMVEGFESLIGRIGAPCKSDDTSAIPFSTVLDGADDYVSGMLSGMPLSQVEDRGWADAGQRLKAVRLTLDEVELRRSAGMIKGLTSVKHDVEMFVGMATLRPTGGRVLDSHMQQVFVRLERTDFFSMATHGNVDYSFLDYITLRIHQVKDEADAKAGPAQFLSVTFTIPDYLSANPSTNIVPLGAVRVGRGSRFSSATWFQACASADDAEASEQAVWEEDAIRRTFGDRLGQTCAPAMTMCQNSVRFNERFVMMNVPVGIAFFETGQNAWSSGREMLFIELVVSAIEDSGKAVQTRLKGMVSVVEGGVNTWCEDANAETSLKAVADVDIIVGSAGTESDLAQLRTFENVASNALAKTDSSHIDTGGIEGGLMTLVLKGAEEFFNLPGQLTTSLELEDVVTIHIMESGTRMYNAVLGLLEKGKGFELLVDAMDHRVSLTPHRELSRYCSFRAGRPNLEDPFPTSCIVRRDIENRMASDPSQLGGAPASAVELNAMGSTEGERGPESIFMQSLLGSSDYAHQLGVNFSSLIAAKYQLNGVSRRAWWINTGYEWAADLTGGQPIFSLSQRVILAALIKLSANDDAAASRRLLVTKTRALPQSGPDAKSMAQLDASYNVDPTFLTAMVLGVHPQRVSTWQVSLLLTDEEACMDSRELRTAMGAVIASYLGSTSTGAQDVLVTSLLLSMGQVDCFSQRRREIRWYSGASVSLETAIVFADETAIVNLERFKAMPGVLEMEAVRSYHNVVIDPNWPLSEDKPPDSASSPTDSWIFATSIVGGSVGACLGCTVAFIWFRAKGKPARTIQTCTRRVASARSSVTGSDLESGAGVACGSKPHLVARVVFECQARPEPAGSDPSFKPRLPADVVRSKWRQHRDEVKRRELVHSSTSGLSAGRAASSSPFGRAASSGASSGAGRLQSLDLSADLNMEHQPLSPTSLSESRSDSPASDFEDDAYRSSYKLSCPGLAPVTLETEAYMAEMLQHRIARSTIFRRPPPIRASQTLQSLPVCPPPLRSPSAPSAPTGSFGWIQESVKQLFKPTASSPGVLQSQPAAQPLGGELVSSADPASILDPECPYPYVHRPSHEGSRRPSHQPRGSRHVSREHSRRPSREGHSRHASQERSSSRHPRHERSRTSVCVDADTGSGSAARRARAPAELEPGLGRASLSLDRPVSLSTRPEMMMSPRVSDWQARPTETLLSLLSQTQQNQARFGASATALQVQVPANSTASGDEEGEDASTSVSILSYFQF